MSTNENRSESVFPGNPRVVARSRQGLRPAFVATTVLAAVASAAGCSGAVDDETAGVGATGTTSAALSTSTLKVRVTQPKPAKTKISATARQDQVIVKFVEGSRVRLRGANLTVDSTALSSQDTTRLQRAGLDKSVIGSLLSGVAASLASHSASSVDRLFQRTEADLDAERASGEASIGAELADLNLFYEVSVPPALAASLIDDLNANDLVEIAYAPEIPVPALTDTPPTTPSYVANQGYLNPAPQGIDAKYAWTLNGGSGAGVRLIDVEHSWTYAHEDLPGPFTAIGTNCTPAQDDGNHGQAVLGEMVSGNNAYGTTGVCYSASFGTSTSCNTSFANAVSLASGALSAGDFIEIELQIAGPESGTTCTGCNCMQWKDVPLEYDMPTFAAIQAATATGRIVVEAAGNGSVNFDNTAVYGNLFQRSSHDSGAIMVGAGVSNSRTPECFTNYGSRVDVQGWGDSVMTLGYGASNTEGVSGISVNGSDATQFYATGFSGTSSATPIVLGAAADIQGNRKALGQSVYTPSQMRSLLASTGTPQPTPVTQNIGPLPNLRAVFAPKQPPEAGNLAAVRQSTNISAVFAVGADGALYRRQATGSGAFGAPVAMSAPNFAPPGAGVATGFQATNQLDVFVTGNDGKIYYFTEVNDGAWSSATALSAAIAKPGARLATANQVPGQLDVFVVDTNGTLDVYWVLGTGNTWFGPGQIATNFAPSGSTLAAGFQGTTNQLDVFAIGNDGALHTSWVVGSGSWSLFPLSLSGTSAAPPGGGVGIGHQGASQTDVFFVGYDGFVKAAWVVNQGAWNLPINLGTSSIANGGADITTSLQGAAGQLDVFVADSFGTVQAFAAVGALWAGPVAITPVGYIVPGGSLAPATQGSSALDLFLIGGSGLGVISTTGGAWSSPTLIQ